MASVPDRLTQIWDTPPGIIGFLGAVNHKAIGFRFVITALAFFVLAGIDATIIRSQLARPNQDVVSSQTFQELFTVHGTAMMFLFAVPILEGLAMYLVPLMIGARDLPFPRLNAFGYWCYLFGGLFFFSSVFIEDSLPQPIRNFLLEYLPLSAPIVPDGGWYAYPPLTGPDFATGSGLDFWLLGVSFIEIAAILGAIEIIVAAFTTRAPGMTLTRMPLFVWTMVVVAFMILFAFPPLLIGSILLEIERKFGLPFYSTGGGGDPLLWQHLFWIFGHPEVYIISLPAIGLVAMMIAPFTRRPVVGYTWLAVAAVVTGFLSFGVWVHHMYTAGLPLLGMSFFAAASLMIAIPTAVQIFAYIATIWTGRIIFSIPMLWILAFIVLFVLGGITGVMIAVTPFDWQVHDTHFIVAHFHYVLIPGAVFPIFAAFYHWWPKFTGRLLSTKLGYAHFILFVLGFFLTFTPLHVAGFLGMRRRVFTYNAGEGLEIYNLVATGGAFIMAAGVIAFLINLIWSQARGAVAGPDPWNANSLEWSVPSPPPPYNFRIIPTVQSRNPMWDGKSIPESPEGIGALFAEPNHFRREQLITSVLDAEPKEVATLAGQSLAPLAAAIGIGMFFGGFLIDFWLFAGLGLLVTIGAILFWVWPGEEFPDDESGTIDS